MKTTPAPLTIHYKTMAIILLIIYSVSFHPSPDRRLGVIVSLEVMTTSVSTLFIAAQCATSLPFQLSKRICTKRARCHQLQLHKPFVCRLSSETNRPSHQDDKINSTGVSLLDRDDSAATSNDVSELFQEQRIFVVDGFGLLFRSFYALVSTTMTSANMFDTRAVFGFANVLLSLLQKHVKGDPVVVVFEGERKQGQLDHRRAAYPEYKSNRRKTPIGIIEAIP